MYNLFLRTKEEESRTPEQKKIVQVMAQIKSTQVVMGNTKTKAKKIETYAGKLRELGMISAAEKEDRNTERYMREVDIATHGYTRIPFEKLKEHEQSLPEKFELRIDSIHDYEGSPPRTVLRKLATAKRREVFNSFSIISVQEKQEEKQIPDTDPILVGQIEESRDYYFIDEWGSDISIKDILGEKK